MTKLEFLDKINDILVGLNTLESDLLGSLYDELMRDAGWRPGSELPPVNKDTGYSDVVCFYATARDGRKLFLFEGRYCKAYIGEKKAHNPFINDGWCYADGGKINEVLNVKWWCYPPKE